MMRFDPSKVTRYVLVCTLVFTALYTIQLSMKTKRSDPDPSVRESRGDPDLDLTGAYFNVARKLEPSNAFSNVSRELEQVDAFSNVEERPFQFDSRYKNPCWYDVNNQLRCLPYFFIVGIRKGGTTNLWCYIMRHPEVLVPGKKENQLFGYKQTDVSFADGLDRYVRFFDEVSKTISLMTNASSGQNKYVFGDGSTSPLYLNRYWKQYEGNEGLDEPRYVTFDLVHRVLPDSKIIISFRDPVERLYSEYFFAHGSLMNQNNLGPEGFHEEVVNVIDLYEECFKRSTVRSCVYNHAGIKESSNMLILLEVGIYHVYMEDLLRIFGREQIFVLRMEDVGLKSTLANVFKFLNLSSLSDRSLSFIIEGKRMKNTREPEYAEKGPMLNATRKLLEDFYGPFNERMASLMNDKYFLFADNEIVPINP